MTSVGCGHLLSDALRWAFVVGALGFAVGFFGPMLLTPDANQGPMLGIFITGPLGFLLGGIAGAIRAARRGPRASGTTRGSGRRTGP